MYSRPVLPPGAGCVPELLLIGLILFAGCNGESSPSGDSSRDGSSSSSSGGGLVEGLPLPSALSQGLASEKNGDQRTETADLKCRIRFVDVHEETGLDFVFDNGTSRAKLMLESTGGGAGWIDYDMDGYWDLFLPQGGNPFSMKERRDSNDQLFRNLSGKEFIRVTERAGLSDAVYGHGVAVGDFDDDGFDDIYVTNVGPDVLYKNCGDGTFLDVTLSAKIDNPLWGSSAAWGDLDLDGDLDLYVCNYLDYDPRNPVPCLSAEGKPGICHPNEIDPVPNKWYLNLGDGTFQNLAEQRGLNAPRGKSLGVVIADFNGDQLPDVYVANDTEANHLFTNRGHAEFKEHGLAHGCGFSGLGKFQASMGIAFGDYDNNGFPDLYLTHFTEDSNTLYANYGSGGFEDVTRKTGLHLPTYNYLGFGTVMADFDYNGRQDLFIANGHIDDWRDRTGDMWYMPAQLFSYVGPEWHECTESGGPYFQRPLLGRAVASADYDNDGDIDLAVAHQNDPVGLLRNESERGHWLKLEFIGRESNRRGIGVQVTVTQGGSRFVQQLPGGTSYCASHQPALFFGLGESAELCRIAVRWPGGKRQELMNVSVDQALVLRERNAEAP